MPDAFARVPLKDLSLSEARELVKDASWFDNTRVYVLFHFNVRPSEYEDLTVATHTEMVAFMKQQGLLDGIT